MFRSTRLVVAALCLIFLPWPHSHAVEPSPVDGFDPYHSAFSNIVVQGDGKIVVGNVRMNNDGTSDTRIDGWLSIGRLLDDDKLIASGQIRDGAGYIGVARLNRDGSVDPAFHSAITPGNYFRKIEIQPDGKILLALNNAIVRLNADGTTDTAFSTATVSTYIKSIIAQPDGRIVIGGNFTAVNGMARTYIARLNEDGSLDTSYNPVLGAAFIEMAPQAGGKVLLLGFNSTVNGTACLNAARLNPDGSLDKAFSDEFIFCNSQIAPIYGIKAALRLHDGRTLIYVNNLAIGRINQEGTLEEDFAIKPFTFIPDQSAEQPDGKFLFAAIISGGKFSFTLFERYNPDGTRDLTFNPCHGANANVCAIAVQLGGTVLAGGAFTSVDGTACKHVARLSLEDGRLDTTFTTGTGANADVNAIAAQATGKIVLGGAFTSINGNTANHLARLNADGSVDTSFSLSGANDIVNAIVQSADKLIVAGRFTTLNGKPCTRLAQLRSDGSVAYTYGTGANGEVNTLAVQPDGKLVLGGDFGIVRANPRNRIARLTTTGSVDPGFAPAGPNAAINCALVQPDGKIIVGGAFTTMNGVTCNHIARLNPDGSLDATFDPGSGANGTIHSIALQANGRIQIAGEFTTINGVQQNHIARLNADGSLDASYDLGSGADANVLALAMQSDGKTLAGGEFMNIKDIARSRYARLSNPDSSRHRITVSNHGNTIVYEPGGGAPAPYQVEFEHSFDGAKWYSLGYGTPEPGAVCVLDQPNLPITVPQYLRATGWVSCGKNNGSVSLVRWTSYYFEELPQPNAAADWIWLE